MSRVVITDWLGLICTGAPMNPAPLILNPKTLVKSLTAHHESGAEDGSRP